MKHSKIINLSEVLYEKLREESFKLKKPATEIIMIALEQYFARKIAERKEQNET